VDMFMILDHTWKNIVLLAHASHDINSEHSRHHKGTTQSVE
jgi:hypothetical protein